MSDFIRFEPLKKHRYRVTGRNLSVAKGGTIPVLFGETKKNMLHTESEPHLTIHRGKEFRIRLCMFDPLKEEFHRVSWIH